MEASRARSKSASENIMFADLPPSSVRIFLSVLPDSEPIDLPVSVPPVNAITSMFSSGTLKYSIICSLSEIVDV